LIVPVKRRHSKKLEDISDEEEAWLRADDRSAGFIKFLPEEQLAHLWDQNSDRLIEEHVAESPGTRPHRWWQYDAPRSAVGTYPDCYYDGKLPEPRRRLGGVGTPCHECLAHVPHFAYGVPTTWVSQQDVEYYTGKARDVHGNLINPKPRGTFEGVAIDPNDPPTYESQAAYLERHGLFLPGERRRLSKRDFEPETISPPDVEGVA
jgi:hypothetical protein